MTANVHLSVALSDYDHVRDFTSGKVRAEGIDITHIDLPVEEIFSRTTRFREWDVAEMSLARYVSLLSQGDTGLVAIPVFPSRFFRQHAIYVASERPLDGPGDLAGRRVGVPEWVQTALVWLRAYLVHQAGVPLESIQWYQAGVNVPGHVDEVRARLPDGLDYRPVPGRSLTDMLVAGELDAILTARPPQAFVDGDRRIRRLFDDYRAEEVRYWEETRLFPIMHTVVLRREVFEAHPWIGPNLFKALEAAKQASIARLLDANICRFPLPWGFAYAERSRERFGDDFWPYGLEPNRRALEAFVGYAAEQGVVHRPLAVEELFPPSVRALYRV